MSLAALLVLLSSEIAGAQGPPPSPHPADAQSPSPAPTLQTPTGRPAAVDLALRSPPDRYGIPTALYPIDPQLGGFRDAAEAQARGRRSTGTILIGAGVAVAVLSAVLFWRASENAEAAAELRRRGQIVTRDPSGVQYVFAVLNAGLALGGIGYGISLAAAPPDATLLQRYYEETYGGPPTPALGR